MYMYTYIHRYISPSLYILCPGPPRRPACRIIMIIIIIIIIMMIIMIILMMITINKEN